MCVARFGPRFLDAAPVPTEGSAHQEGTCVDEGPDRDPPHAADGRPARPFRVKVPAFPRACPVKADACSRGAGSVVVLEARPRFFERQLRVCAHVDR